MQTVLSGFNHKPQSHIAWRALWFGVGSFLILPVLGILVIIVNRTLNRGTSLAGPTAVSSGMLMATMSLALSVTGVVYGVKAIRSGEHSWVVWFGTVIASIVALFWVAMFVGELIFPH